MLNPDLKIFIRDIKKKFIWDTIKWEYSKKKKREKKIKKKGRKKGLHLPNRWRVDSGATFGNILTRFFFI